MLGGVSVHHAHPFVHCGHKDGAGLPAGGFARHSAGLSVRSFLRGIHVIDYEREALREVADKVVALANAEDLPAHGEAVLARFPEGAR